MTKNDVLSALEANWCALTQGVGPSPRDVAAAVEANPAYQDDILQLAADIVEYRYFEARNNPSPARIAHLISVGTGFFRDPNRPNDAPNSLGELAKRKGRDLARIADQIKCPRETIGLLELGKVLPPFRDTLVVALAQALDVTAENVRDALAASLVTRRLGHASADGIEEVSWYSFDALICSSDLSNEQKSVWLES